MSSYDYSAETVEDLLIGLGAGTVQQQVSNSTWSCLNIFGGHQPPITTSRNPIRAFQEPCHFSTDIFYINAYKYYYNRGFINTIVSSVLEVCSFVCGAIATYLITSCIDIERLVADCSNKTSVDISKYIHYNAPPNIFCTSLILVSCSLALWKIFWFIIEFPQLTRTHHFYTVTLGINRKSLAFMSWADVISRISQNHNINLSIQDITGRILRKDNYYNALFHRSILRISDNFYTRQLEYNLKFVMFSELDDVRVINSRFLRNKFIMAGIINGLLSPFIFIYTLLYFVATNIDDFYLNKTLTTRKYNLVTNWKFKNFNELDHFFEARVKRSVRFADEYVDQFPNPIALELCKFISLISGALFGLLLLASIIQEGVLLHLQIGGRTLLFYAGVLGAITASTRHVIKSHENKLYTPDDIMKIIIKHTHYVPKYYTSESAGSKYLVRDDFLRLYQFRLVLFAYDIASIFVTPIYLIFILPRSCAEIVNFVKLHTSYDSSIGAICSYAVFSNGEINDYKMEQSISSFKNNHSVDIGH